MAVSDYSTTPSLNTAINGIDISENCPAGGLNDAIRQIMADIATFAATQALPSLLPIARGGTGAATADAALTALGGLPLAFRDLQVVTKTSNYALAPDDRAKLIRYAGSNDATFTLPRNGDSPFTSGATFVILNDSSKQLTIARGTGVVLRVAGSTNDANRTIDSAGLVTLVRASTDRWYASGAGLS